MSALCQKRTKCAAAILSLFDHLVGGRKQRLRNVELKRLCSLKIYDEREFGHLLNRNIRRPFTFEDFVDKLRRNGRTVEMTGRRSFAVTWTICCRKATSTGVSNITRPVAPALAAAVRLVATSSAVRASQITSFCPRASAALRSSGSATRVYGAPGSSSTAMV